MSDRVLFNMWHGTRDAFIAEHKFYLEQAHQRLLSQFNNIDNEATKAADDYWSESGKYFDPDRDDESMMAEEAYNVGGEHYRLLTEMHERTRLSVVAGMYHEWDKKLREWLIDESRHFGGREAVAEVLWRKPFDKIVELMDRLDWDISGKEYYPLLKACDLVVNVHKHGEGHSLETLKKQFPEYLPDPFGEHSFGHYDATQADHTHLRITDEQIKGFSDSIIKFWLSIPERTYDSDDLNAPQWFMDALKKDTAAKRSTP